jgi:hypothetical protein
MLMCWRTDSEAGSGPNVLGFAGAGEGEHGFEFDIVGEAARLLGQNGAALVVDAVGALFGLRQTGGDAVAVGGQEGGKVDQHAISFTAQDLAGPQDRGGERFHHGRAFVAVGRIGDVVGVVLDQEQAVSALFEAHHAHLAGLAAIEADVVRAQAVWQ